MTWLKSMCIAFATYSKIPVPNVDWNEKNMKYSICYFPLVSIPIGIAQILAWYLCGYFNFNDILKGTLMASIPILVTGGIHLDGFCDTSDAISSYQPKERKLEILKDSHIGAFALIKTLLYIILYLGVISNIDSITSVLILNICYCIVRALSGLSVVTFNNARKDGMLHAFSSMSEKNTVIVTMISYVAVSFTVMGFLNLKSCILNLILSSLVFIYYRKMSYKTFGGITGDIAGYFLQLCELVLLFGTILTN